MSEKKMIENNKVSVIGEVVSEFLHSATKYSGKDFISQTWQSAV